ncbi:hypothetical protein Tco_1564384 [Tanacetum coccineum]
MMMLCHTALTSGIAIERLQQGESLNVQDVKTNLFWEFGKFTSQDGESMESYYSRFYKLMNELTRNNLQVTTMQQFQLEVKDRVPEKNSQSANPLAILRCSTLNPEQAQRDKECKRIWNSMQSYFKKLYNLQQQPSNFFKLMNKTERYHTRNNNDPTSSQFGNQRTMKVLGQSGLKDYAYHKEKMMMCKPAEHGVPLHAEQAGLLEDTVEEIDDM